MAKLNSSSESRKKLVRLPSGRSVVCDITEPLVNAELAQLPSTMTRREKRAFLRKYKKYLSKNPTQPVS